MSAAEVASVELLVGVLGGLISATIIASTVTIWRHRGHLSTLWLYALGRAPVRVSIAVLLRIQDDDGYLLFHTPFTPGSFGPPGGVVKYDTTARPTLDRLEFREERRMGRPVMNADLRGFVAARWIPAFLRWVAGGEGRESAISCLRRELAEEFVEVGHDELVPMANGLSFRRVRVILEPPRRVPGRDYRQVRRFEVWDLLLTDAVSVRLRDRLLELARSESEPGIQLATSNDIVSGRVGSAFVGPQSAFLLGSRRIRADIAPLP